jgi:hypothetical protein
LDGGGEKEMRKYYNVIPPWMEFSIIMAGMVMIMFVGYLLRR